VRKIHNWKHFTLVYEKYLNETQLRNQQAQTYIHLGKRGNYIKRNWGYFNRDTFIGGFYEYGKRQPGWQVVQDDMIKHEPGDAICKDSEGWQLSSTVNLVYPAVSTWEDSIANKRQPIFHVEIQQSEGLYVSYRH